jgi:hypothetical protein
VEVLRSYSNQSDLLAELERAVGDLGNAVADPAEVSMSVRSDRVPGQRSRVAVGPLRAVCATLPLSVL